jgi:predicted nucleic acid-binding protein
VLHAPETHVFVPDLCDVEVVAGIRRAVIRRKVQPARARQAVQDYLDLPLTRHGHSNLLPRMLELRSNFSAYDACYVALAEGLNAELLTADLPLARAVRAHTDVQVIGEIGSD